MKDFWNSCGHNLLDRNAGGGLVVTDEFLKAYFARPELMPPDDACAIERRLRRDLFADPRRPVGADEVAVIADSDARENWQFVLAFRDLLLRYPTLEAAYLALLRPGSVVLPPLFVNQLVHVILRNVLDGCEDPFVLRAAELFFRPQRIMPHEHSLLLGDEEIIGESSPTPVLSLMSMLGAATDAQVDVLSELEPLVELHNAKLSWYIGLDAEATRIGDQLWHGEILDDRTAGRVLALFRLDVADAALVADTLDREPVYLILAMTSEQIVRMKPQNLLTGLPVQHLEAAS